MGPFRLSRWKNKTAWRSDVKCHWSLVICHLQNQPVTGNK
jgi:hypothetical protein